LEERGGGWGVREKGGLPAQSVFEREERGNGYPGGRMGKTLRAFRLICVVADTTKELERKGVEAQEKCAISVVGGKVAWQATPLRTPEERMK